MMRKALYLLATIGIATLTLTAMPTTSQAQTVYPWCAHYGGRDMGGAPSCGFVSYAQCMATIQGMGGWCSENPWYEPAPPRRPRRVQ
jgi:hypothetical protein